MAILSPSPKLQFFDANGNPLVGGKLYSYTAGTTSPLATYTDSTNTSANTNPIILDSRGEANVWLGVGSYKMVLRDSVDALIWTVDNILGAPSSNAALVALAASDGSSLVGFIQSGTEAVATTVQTKLSESVSVKDFGAVGDGVTDDTVAIQAAFNSGRFNIYFPSGTYIVSSTLTTFSNGMILRGDGIVRSVIKQTNAALATPTLRTDPANTRLFGFEISDIRIEQPNGATNTALQVNNPNFRCVVERVRVDCDSGASSAGNAIHIKRASSSTDGYFTTIHNCWVDKHAYGIWIEGANPGGANVHWITQTTVTLATSYGVWVKNAGSVYVSHGHIELCGTGVYGDSVSNLVVEKSYFERNSNFDVDLLSGDSCLIESNQHNSSAYTNASGSAIRLQAGEHHRIRDNWFNERFSSFDVRISAGVNNTSIIGNVAKARDINGGWQSSGPVVQDSGTSTFYANTQYTSGGTRQFYFSGPATHNAPTLVRPLISRVNGSDPFPEILSGSSNPTTGVAANIGSIYLRNGASPGFWQKTSAPDTGWVQIT